MRTKAEPIATLVSVPNATKDQMVAAHKTIAPVFGTYVTWVLSTYTMTGLGHGLPSSRHPDFQLSDLDLTNRKPIDGQPTADW